MLKRLLALALVFCAFLTVTACAEGESSDFPMERLIAKAYNNVWVAEDGDWRAEIYLEDDGLRVLIDHKLGDNKEDVWEYAAMLGDNFNLVTVPLGQHYCRNTVTDDWETYYEDGDAEFALSDTGMLLWNDLKEDAGKGLAFKKIGLFYGTRWMKDDIEVYFWEWYDDCYDIRLYQRGAEDEILKATILKGEYDLSSDSVTATGEFEGEEPFTVTFSYDTDYDMIWTENGVDTVLEESFLTD